MILGIVTERAGGEFIFPPCFIFMISKCLQVLISNIIS